MHVPCPVPLSQPWSPVDYQVVQGSEEKKLPVEEGPRKIKRSAARSPLGYRVNVVADEDIPPLPRAHSKAEMFASDLQRTRISRISPRNGNGFVISGPIVAGGMFFLLPVLAIAFSLGTRAPEPHFVQAPHFDPPPMPPPPDIVIPNELFNAVAEKPPAEEPQAAEVKDAGACETFGTHVEFVRNPQVASKLARDEGKLAFLLHVSGNFEDSRFT